MFDTGPMGQLRKEREWPAPRNTRHVWVLGEDRLTPPTQGYVVAWRRHAHKWSALVVTVVGVDADEQLIQRWLPVERLRPVRSDPNKVIHWASFGEMLRPPQS